MAANPAPLHIVHSPAGPGPGVLVLHAWWGLNDFCKGFCDRLAGAGFTVLAPDLYHGAVAATIDEAKKLRGKLKGETVAADVTQAAGRLQELCGRAEIGLVGFSLGGYWGLWLADQPANPVRAAVVFYGARQGDYAANRAAFQFHLAERDDYVADSGVKKLRKSLAAAGREAEFHTYPGTGHWFFEADRPDAFQPQAAELAWERTVAFLKGILDSGF
jgi:carboxymethylenebutenolidase